MSRELREKAHEIDELFYALVDDVISSAELWDQRKDDFSRRIYVRTVFAAVEGIVQVMKKIALLQNELNAQTLLTPEEVTLLREEDLQIGRSGSVRVTKKKISLLPNFEFAFSMNAKVTGNATQFDKSGEGWKRLQQAIKVRDRLTHPNQLLDLEISDDDMVVVEEAMSFFREVTATLLLRDENDG